MAVSALVGVAAMLGFITIRWPGDSGRYVVVAIIASVIAFLGFASAAVFTAARDTYPREGPKEGGD
jgi:hypothetical protein